MATQSDWDTYNTNIAGSWQLCANCGPALSGKKLFRQYNYFRQQMGLPPVLTPISNSEYAFVSAMNAQMTLHQSTQVWTYRLAWNPPTFTGGCSMKGGAAGLNPAAPLTVANNGNSSPSAGMVAFLQGLVKYLLPATLSFGNHPFTTSVCPFTDNGAPGNAVTLNGNVLVF